MIKPELLAPAGSPEGVRAAVQNGADAVYMGFGTFNARRGAQNFSREEMAQAICYCRERGVKTNITFNILVSDRELETALQDARFLYEAGADALIVQDLGIARFLRQCAPEIALHASTQMTIHTLEGAKQAKALGFSRVVLARECTLEQIREITANAGIETEVFVHGALCMCYSGQCYFSSVIGRRSGNRGMCAQPCRLPYAYQDRKSSYPLSLKDLCLASWLTALTEAGVSSLKIEGRMKRPEYTAIVTKIYADLLREKRMPTKEEQSVLEQVFSRTGFTDGYLTGCKGNSMFGIKKDLPLKQVQPLYEEAAKHFSEGKELQRIPLYLDFTAIEGEKMCLSGTISLGRSQTVYRVFGSIPVPAIHRPAGADSVEKALRKTGGTPFFVQEIKIHLSEGLAIPTSSLNGLRRDLLNKILRAQSDSLHRIWQEPVFSPKNEKQELFKGYLVQVRELAQITEKVLAVRPAGVYAPLTALAENGERTQAIAKRVPVAAILPRIYQDNEQPEIVALLKKVLHMGVSAAVAQNLGQITCIQDAGLIPYGDYGMNIINSAALQTMDFLGVRRQTVSFEMRLSQIRDLYKPIETELLVYGYLPLMLLENCIIRRKNGRCSCKEEVCTLTDRRNKIFQVLPENGCRNTLLNSQPLFLPNRDEYVHLGVPYARLFFTTESPEQCGRIAEAITQGRTVTFQEETTRGLYFRGVE